MKRIHGRKNQPLEYVEFQIKSAYIKVLKNDYGDPVGAVVVSYINNDYDIRADKIDRLIWFIEDKLISSLNK